MFLQFIVDDLRYAIDVNDVVEILPYLSLQNIPHSPDSVVGLFDYHGKTVPVIDLCLVLGSDRCERRLSNRIVLVYYTGGNGEKHLVGLLGRQVTDTLDLEPEDFYESGVKSETASYLGTVAKDEQGLVNLIKPQSLIASEVAAVLFAES